jgi:beta-glucuronidase
MLKPQSSATRELVNIDGLWDFKVDFKDEGHGHGWWKKSLETDLDIAVPSSYNDIYTDVAIREHVGWVWYQRSAFIPKGWNEDRIFIRIDAATHEGIVFVNDVEVARHRGGYMPFEADISSHVKAGEEVRITVAVSNVLTNETIPPGEVVTLDTGRKQQTYLHDFYNYSGLARSVWLYSVPQTHISDVTVQTDFAGSIGKVSYKVELDGSAKSDITAIIFDESGKEVGRGNGASGEITIPDVKLWKPRNAYLYKLVLESSDGGKLLDSYSLNVGVRTIKVEGNQFLINNEPFYFTGFGMHEDHVVIGKGHNNAFLVNDFELLKWTGANSFRTSHYPYAEEVMDYADRHGFVVIDETAAVGLNMSMMGGVFGGENKETFTPETCNDNTQAELLKSLRELIARDKNHPSVVMWSITNEADTNPDASYDFFKPAFELTHELDPTRPNTYINVMFARVNNCKVAPLADVICLNRYWGWYVDHFDLESAEKHLDAELSAWESKYSVPIVITEYGADTLVGGHSIHNLPWSEEYQSEFLDMHHRVFDKHQSIVGEQIWNFADFQTKPGIFRVLGNKKGVFSRDRQPKAAAHLVRARWTRIGNKKNKG